MARQLQRYQQVSETIGLSRSEIYRLISLDLFPKPIRIGSRAVAWDAGAVQQWIEAKKSHGDDGLIRPDDNAKLTEGRKAFWDAVRRGDRPHPRSMKGVRK